MLAAGLTNAEIARARLSEATIKSHVSSLLGKACATAPKR